MCSAMRTPNTAATANDMQAQQNDDEDVNEGEAKRTRSEKEIHTTE